MPPAIACASCGSDRACLVAYCNSAACCHSASDSCTRTSLVDGTLRSKVI